MAASVTTPPGDADARVPELTVAAEFALTRDRYRQAAAAAAAALYQLGEPDLCGAATSYGELTAALDRYKQVAFAGAMRERLPISGKRLNKLSRRLHEANENETAIRRRVDCAAARLRRALPGYPAAAYRHAGLVLMVLREWDMSGCPEAAQLRRGGLAAAVMESVARDAPIRLALFVCPPANFEALRSDDPASYIGDNLHASVLSRQVPRLRPLFRDLEAIGVTVELLAIVGDTDEDDYIWPVLGRPEKLDPAALDAASVRLAASVASYLTAPTLRQNRWEPKVATTDVVRVLRLSALPEDPAAEAVRRRLADDPWIAFDRSDLAAEARIMSKLFEFGSYYQGLAVPIRWQLEQMIRLKFASYAAQGLALRKLDPALVLLQTERPSRLRNRMINAGLVASGMPPIPAIDLYRPDAAFVL